MNAKIPVGRAAYVLKDFSPDRLIIAREARGLQKRELAAAIEATPSAISQFERGRARPNAETVLRLALALGVPPEFFRGKHTPVISPEACHFRRLRSSSQVEQRRVRAVGALLMMVFEHLEQFVDLPRESLTALSNSLEDGIDIETAAQKVRSAWGLGSGPIQNMVGLLEREGVVVIEAPGHSSRLDAFSAWVGGRPLVFLSTDKDSASRRRFAAAHELGHLLLHPDVLPGAVDLERQADAFASALLLPKEPFAAECPRVLNWDRLLVMKDRWKVSLAAIVRRAYTLGVYSEATYRRAYVQLSSRGWRTNEPCEPSLERPRTLRRAVELLEGNGYSREAIARAVALHPDHLADLASGADSWIVAQ